MEINSLIVLERFSGPFVGSAAVIDRRLSVFIGVYHICVISKTLHLVMTAISQ
jgi:hypothetical protein